jgi:hypothetical protein
VVQWLLEYGGAQITVTDNEGESVWNVSNWEYGLPGLLKHAYKRSDDGEFVPIDGGYVPNGDIDLVALNAMMRVVLLHGGHSELLVKDLAPPLQQLVRDGVRLRARLPGFLAQRRALIESHCTLLPPLRDLVHGYEEPTTTDELWATGPGTSMQPC